MESELASEKGVDEFVVKMADQAREAIDVGRFQPVAFVMSVQFPIEPAIIYIGPWMLRAPEVLVNVLKTAVAKFDAFGVLTVCEATRHEPSSGTEEEVILFQLDHKYIGGKAWHAPLKNGKMGELIKLPTPRGGSFFGIIPAEEKAN